MAGLQHMACSAPLGMSSRLRVRAQVFMLTLGGWLEKKKKKAMREKEPVHTTEVIHRVSAALVPPWSEKIPLTFLLPLQSGKASSILKLFRQPVDGLNTHLPHSTLWMMGSQNHFQPGCQMKQNSVSPVGYGLIKTQKNFFFTPQKRHTSLSKFSQGHETNSSYCTKQKLVNEYLLYFWNLSMLKLQLGPILFQIITPTKTGIRDLRAQPR